MKLAIKLPATLLAIGIALSASAQDLKKCVDANGKVSYSDQACPDSAASTSVKISTAVATSAPSQRTDALISENMKTLYACEKGKQEACFAKETLDRRCTRQRKQTALPSSDCLAYEADRSKFQELNSACNKEGNTESCITLACIGGEANSCERLKDVDEKKQRNLSKRIEDAGKQGLPSGNGWFMSQDWREIGEGSQAAIVTCTANRSIVLKKKAPMTQRILTSVTGTEYFLTIEEAAKKGCGKA